MGSTDGELPLEVSERGPTLLERLRGERTRYKLFLRSALYNFVAGNEHAVIVGLGGQVFFAQVRHALRALLVAPFEKRVERMESAFSDRESAARAVRQHDREWTGYHQYVHQVAWLDPELYHMVINTGETRPETVAELLARTAELPEYQPTPESLRLLQDQALAARLEAKLASVPELPSGRVVVQVREGLVTVSGILESEMERHTVQTVLRETPGAGEVANELAVLPRRSQDGI